MTYNVFGGTLNLTQSIVDLDWHAAYLAESAAYLLPAVNNTTTTAVTKKPFKDTAFNYSMPLTNTDFSRVS